jgi:hypothetical protein
VFNIKRIGFIMLWPLHICANILPVFTSICQYLPAFTSFYQLLPAFTSIYQYVPAFTSIYQYNTGNHQWIYQHLPVQRPPWLGMKRSQELFFWTGRAGVKNWTKNRQQRKMHNWLVV